MDQLTIFEELQKLIDNYEVIINKRYDQLQDDVLLLLDKYYSKYGESLDGYLKYYRLQSLQRDIDQVATEHYQQMANDLQQASEETSAMTYLLYAYLIYMFAGEEDGEILPLTSATAKVSVALAIAYMLLKAAKKPTTFFFDLQVDLSLVMKKYKDDYAYGVFNDVKQNLRSEGGQTELSKQVKKRTARMRGFSVSHLYETLNDVINYVQEKVFQTATSQNEEAKRTDNKEKDMTKYSGRNLKEVVNDVANSTKSKVNDIVGKQLNLTKVWASMKDHRVRLAHRILDGAVADKDGWFHYQGDKAKKPKGFTKSELNYGCRCKLLLLINGQLPRTSKIYDYTDADYQRKLNKRIAELVAEDKTYIQAYKQARNEIKAPRRTIKGYITFEEFWDKYGPQEGNKR